MTVPAERAEVVRARMIALFPEGFEEVVHADGIEFAAYTDSGGEERLWHAFGRASTEEIEDGWDERWRAFHRPSEVVGLWIGPPWISPPAGRSAVVIEPGRAFGTGSHPTTRLALELLATLDRGSLLDIGCGSGVLAIAAVRLGFGPVSATDVDESAVDATRRNAAANGVVVAVTHSDAVEAPQPTVDICVANITRELVEQIVPRVRCTYAVTSGYLLPDEPRLSGFRHVARSAADGWTADVFRHVGE